MFICLLIALQRIDNRIYDLIRAEVVMTSAFYIKECDFYRNDRARRKNQLRNTNLAEIYIICSRSSRIFWI